MKFGKRLKQARIDQHLTQEQVASAFFLTRQTISNWENEKTYPDINSLIKLSDYYHISLDTLLKEDTGMKEYLERKAVIRSLKPITISLVVIDILFLTLVALDLTHLIKLSNIASIILIAFGGLNAVALLQLNFLNHKIGAHRSKVMFSQHKSLVAGLLLMTTGLLISWLANQDIIGGMLAGIGSVAIAYYLSQKLSHRA